MNLGFSGKVALVTGAGSQIGFGREIALLLAAEGIEAVAVVDVDLDGVERTAQAVRSAGAHSIALAADITDVTAVNAMVANAATEYGRIDILCNVAGAILHKDFLSIVQQDPAVWERQFKINVIGTMNVTQAVVPIMRSHNYGVVVNIGSGSTFQYGLGVHAYAVSKWGLDLLTRQLAFTEAKFGIRANCVAPGPAATNFGGFLKEAEQAKSPEEAEAEMQALLETFPLGRIGTARDIANATVFLASDVTDYITGQVLHVSGGSVI
jgi:3-oxoacyl-[acyl-carrier protein] reductase